MTMMAQTSFYKVPPTSAYFHSLTEPLLPGERGKTGRILTSILQMQKPRLASCQTTLWLKTS